MTAWRRTLAQHGGCAVRAARRGALAAGSPRFIAGGASSNGSTDSHGRQRAGAPSAAAGLGGLAAGISLALATSRPAGCDTDDSEAGRLYPKDLERLLTPSKDNPIPVTCPPPMPGLADQQWQQRHVATIFGLPFRGKAHIARELKRYIEFFHNGRARIFDLSNYMSPGGDEKLHKDLEEFFGQSGEESASDYDAWSLDFGAKKGRSTGGFAIILASDLAESTRSMWSSHTKWHRRWIASTLQERLKAEVCFIQISVDAAIGDKYVADLARFRGRTVEECNSIIAAYQDHYVPIQMDGSESDAPYINLINYNEKVIVNRMMQSFVGSEVCHFLSNLHPYQHTVYLSRHAESEFNVQKRLGGDSSLSERGVEYARRLAEFSRFVIGGQATDLVCVTLTPEEIKAIRARLCQHHKAGPGLYADGDWVDYGDASGGKVKSNMKLVRVQRGFGADFVDAPAAIDEVLKMVDGARECTLVLIDGKLDGAGQTPCRLWTSSLKRTIETAQFIDHSTIPGPGGKPWQQMRGQKFRNLDEVYAGEYDGLTEATIKQINPSVVEDRSKDKMGFRYPRGESYNDVIARIQNTMNRLERIREPTLVVSHQAVLRLVYAWLSQQERDAALEIAVPQHSVIEIRYDGLGGPRKERWYPLGPTNVQHYYR